MSNQPGEGRREAARLEAFSDGVMAVIITIMAFGLNVPRGTTWRAVGQEVPSLLVYLLSFTLIGIYWNNHHHLFRVTHRISSGVMWTNLHLLFWLSLIPVATKWVGQAHEANLPASVYGVVSFGAAVAYGLLVQMIIKANGRDSPVARGIGPDLKGRLSIGLFAVGVGLAWLSPWIAYALYVAVALLWLVPTVGSSPNPRARVERGRATRGSGRNTPHRARLPQPPVRQSGETSDEHELVAGGCQPRSLTVLSGGRSTPPVANGPQEVKVARSLV